MASRTRVFVRVRRQNHITVARASAIGNVCLAARSPLGATARRNATQIACRIAIAAPNARQGTVASTILRQIGVGMANVCRTAGTAIAPRIVRVLSGRQNADAVAIARRNAIVGTLAHRIGTGVAIAR